MAHAFEGALAALRRVAEERSASCADEVARHRLWLRTCTLDAKNTLAQRAGAGAAGAPGSEAAGAALKRARAKKPSVEAADKENDDGAASARAGRSRRAESAAKGESEAGAEEHSEKDSLDLASLCDISMPADATDPVPELPAAAAAATLPHAGTAPALPGPTSQPATEASAVGLPSAALPSVLPATTGVDAQPVPAERIAHERAVQEALCAQLSAAAAIPLPESPCAAVDVAAAGLQNELAALPPAPDAAPAPREPPAGMKQSGKILALQAAEIARKQEERIHEERQAKKEALERQREAARRAAVLNLPTHKDVVVPGDSLVKLQTRAPVAGTTTDFASRPLETGSKALPRLKQAMEAREKLTEANRRNLAQAHREKDEKSAALKQAEEEAKTKHAEDCRSRQHVQDTFAKEQPDGAIIAHAQSAAPASTAVYPPRETPSAPPPPSVIASTPQMQKFSVPGGGATQPAAAPVMLGEAARAALQTSAAAAHPELQSYDISPYKSGSDSDDDAAERPRKPVPAWARSDALGPVLYAQAKADPDSIFQNPSKTCSLDEVFKYGGNKKRDFSRRGSSGNWAEDQLTWKEEQSFKRRMGYIAAAEATPRSVYASRASPAV